MRLFYYLEIPEFFYILYICLFGYIISKLKNKWNIAINSYWISEHLFLEYFFSVFFFVCLSTNNSIVKYEYSDLSRLFVCSTHLCYEHSAFPNMKS